VAPFDGGVLLCAIYPDPAPKHTNSCSPKGSDLSANNNDVVVDFTISVPQGVRLSAHTLIGDVNATSLTSAVDARVLKGTITISTSDSAEANDSHGSINAAIGETNWNGTSVYSAHNGSVDVTIPADANVEVEASAFFGAIMSDFPLTISSTTGGHSTMATGTLGSGGRVLKLSTGNGNINLHKGQ
jgi:DUF4097 and DUF4098 domain-containing protein YvlB